MTSFLERLARGLDAAQGSMGSEELARTNGFELTHTSSCPTVVVRRRKANGEILVDLIIGGASATMTAVEFERFADEFAAFRPVVAGAVAAAARKPGPA